MSNLGAAFYHLGQHDKAIEFYTMDFGIARELGDRAGEGRATDNLEVARHAKKQASVAD